MLVVPSTRRSTLGDRAFPVASARACVEQPAVVCQECTVRRELKTVLRFELARYELVWVRVNWKAPEI